MTTRNSGSSRRSRLEVLADRIFDKEIGSHWIVFYAGVEAGIGGSIVK